jgi:hypothetical protein
MPCPVATTAVKPSSGLTTAQRWPSTVCARRRWGGRRPERLASPSVDDNRISLGCIVVAEVFYDAVVAPHLGRQRSVVYVLPDSRHWTEQFRDAVVIRHGDFGDAAL